jgi:hypothetical protein
MYVLDDRYESVVAFVEGFNLALDGAPLKGFDDWVALKILGEKSPRHWSSIINDSVDESDRVGSLLDLLEEFARNS